MKIRGVILLVAVSGMAVTASARKKKETIPQAFCQARYVYVEPYAIDPMNMDITAEDRLEANQLAQQFQAWKRYILVNDRDKADLVFVFRTGHAPTSQGGNWQSGAAAPDQNPNGMGQSPGGMQPSSAGPGMGQGPQGMGTPNSMGSSEPAGVGTVAGPVNDTLAIYERPGDVRTQKPVWQKSRYEGLAAPRMPLFQQVKKAVDGGCQGQPAGAPPAQ